MNAPSTSDQTNHRFAEAVRAYAPTVPRKWQKLLTLKPGIAELRRRGASYQAITEILRATVDQTEPAAAIARDDDYFIGVLHSKLHELWSRRKGTQVRE